MKTTFQKILNNESLKFIGKTLFYSFHCHCINLSLSLQEYQWRNLHL